MHVLTVLPTQYAQTFTAYKLTLLQSKYAVADLEIAGGGMMGPNNRPRAAAAGRTEAPSGGGFEGAGRRSPSTLLP
jgi:hypothetical protein